MDGVPALFRTKGGESMVFCWLLRAGGIVFGAIDLHFECNDVISIS